MCKNQKYFKKISILHRILYVEICYTDVLPSLNIPCDFSVDSKSFNSFRSAVGFDISDKQYVKANKWANEVIERYNKHTNTDHHE